MSHGPDAIIIISKLIASLIIVAVGIATAIITYRYMKRKKIMHAGIVHQYGQGIITTSQPAYQVLNEVQQYQQQQQLPQQIPPNNLETIIHSQAGYIAAATAAQESSKTPLIDF